jgi:hypothetical protein
MSIPRRNKTREMAVGCVLVVVIGLCVVSYRVISNSRYKVVGKVDPKSGYRIEYTVSSRYSEKIRSSEDEAAVVETIWFERKPLPQPEQWLLAHVLHRPPSNENLYYQKFDARVPIHGQGYPDWQYADNTSPDISSVHMLISGCPATWYAAIVGGSHTYLLMIRPMDRTVIYSFCGTEYGTKSTELATEMVKIRDSIRITKAK